MDDSVNIIWTYENKGCCELTKTHIKKIKEFEEEYELFVNLENT